MMGLNEDSCYICNKPEIVIHIVIPLYYSPSGNYKNYMVLESLASHFNTAVMVHI